MAISKGDTLPDLNLQRMGSEGPEEVSIKSLTTGRKVAIFAVPGAFTPTCSANHLPGYVDHAEQFVSKGVDTIACMAVNDVFVMDAWGKDRQVGDKVVMLADGNGEYADALGLQMDASGFGMGTRGQRFAILVDDGVATHVAIEPPGQFEVSKAESVLAQV